MPRRRARAPRRCPSPARPPRSPRRRRHHRPPHRSWPSARPVLLVLALPAAARAADLATAMPAGHTKVFIGQTSISYADTFAAETGLQPAGGMWYTSAYQDSTAVMDEIAAAVHTHPGLEV